MTGLEALNKFVNSFAEYCVISQHQYLNATNMQTVVEYLARSEECRTIEKSLKALEIIKEKRVNVELFWNDFVDNGFGYHYYLEIWYKYQSTDKQKLTEEEFNLLREVLK